MTNYSRGRQFEYRVKRYLLEHGWLVFRSAGSRSVADLIALRAGEVWLIQCKANGYLTPVQQAGLAAVAKELGALPVIAYRRGRRLVLEEIKRLEAKEDAA